MEEGRQRINRLRWLCRRGMKELDVLLESFLERHHDKLASGGWPELETLLANEDNMLWDWLQGKDSGQSVNFRTLIDAIRN